MLTVNTAAPNRKLTTLAAVKTELSIADGAQDDALNGMIDQMSAAVESFCNRVFAIDAVTESLRLTQGSFDRPEAGGLVPSPLALALDRRDVGDGGRNGAGFNGFRGRFQRRHASASRRRRTKKALERGMRRCRLQRRLQTSCRRRTHPAVRHRACDDRNGAAPLHDEEPRPQPEIHQHSRVLQEDYWVGNLSENGAIPPMVAGLLEPYCASAL